MKTKRRLTSWLHLPFHIVDKIWYFPHLTVQKNMPWFHGIMTHHGRTLSMLYSTVNSLHVRAHMNLLYIVIYEYKRVTIVDYCPNDVLTPNERYLYRLSHKEIIWMYTAQCFLRTVNVFIKCFIIICYWCGYSSFKTCMYGQILILRVTEIIS